VYLTKESCELAHSFSLLTHCIQLYLLQKLSLPHDGDPHNDLATSARTERYLIELN